MFISRERINVGIVIVIEYNIVVKMNEVKFYILIQFNFINLIVNCSRIYIYEYFYKGLEILM